MAKKKLLDDIRARPARFYRLPADVMRDRRFDDNERAAILKSWAGQQDEALAPQIEAALQELEDRLSGSQTGHAAE